MSFLNVGLFLPRVFESIGSSTLIVLDRALAFTTQTSVLFKHTPHLKNEMCDAMRLPRRSPAAGSRGSSASRGNVMTSPSKKY